MANILQKFFLLLMFIGYYSLGLLWNADLTQYTQKPALQVCNIPADKIHYKQMISHAASTYQLPAALIAAVIHAESNFNPRAHSRMGAKGLMQINAVTSQHLKIKNVWDPAQNIFAGARYLRELVDRFGGNLHYAVAAYNAGPGAVSKYKGIPPYRETQNYVRKVMKLMQQYRGDGPAIAQI